MSSYNGIQTKNAKHTRDRYDIYEPEFYSPIQKSPDSKIDRHLHKWAEFVSFIRFYPDIFFDMIKPEKGGITLDLYQRVMMRTLARFPSNYFCIPRGGSKTLIQIMALYHAGIWYPNITLAITATTKEAAVKIWKEKHDEIIRF